MTAERPSFEDCEDEHILRAFPLTEHAGNGAGAIDEDCIRIVVDDFYMSVRDDELLGPIFAQRVQDWTIHLAKMRDFWSTLTLRSGRYAGRPLEVHARIANLSQEYFHRWLTLWTRTVEKHVAPREQKRFVEPASRMAHTMALHCMEQVGRTEQRGTS